MKILSLEISNYRILDNIAVRFSPECTFLVGENNIGKTSLLELLYSIFHRNSLVESDFVDINQPIETTFTLYIEPYEVGYFDDLIDPENNTHITITAIAQDFESDFEFIHKATEQGITSNIIRNIGYLLFKSILLDNKSFRFDRNRGIGRVLVKCIEYYQHENDLNTKDFFDDKQLADLTEAMNKLLGGLPFIGENGISIAINEYDDVSIGGAIIFTDEQNIPFDKIGSGLQYATMTILQILDGILRIPKKRLNEMVVIDEYGNKILPCIIAFDEPEIHLHPYMQRSLIKTLNSIANGKDEEFNKVLNTLCNIDKLSAQIMIATHSPNILGNDYKKIVRFSRNSNGHVDIFSGQEISFDDKVEKHLHMHFDSIKEAFFSRAVLIYEGQTEQGAYPGFAKTLNIDLDRIGAALLSADGKESVMPIQKLFDGFHIPCISIVDQDDRNEPSYRKSMKTSGRDFEEDIANKLVLPEGKDTLVRIISEARTCGISFNINKSKKFYDAGNHVGLSQNQCNSLITSGIILSEELLDKPLLKERLYIWLSINKGIVLGKIIGEEMPSNLIPQHAKDALYSLKDKCS